MGLFLYIWVYINFYKSDPKTHLNIMKKSGAKTLNLGHNDIVGKVTFG